jgi:excisionase family DNA binding protein
MTYEARCEEPGSGEGIKAEGSTAAPATIEPLVFSVAEAAAILGISKDLAYDLIAAGELPSLHFGRRVVVPRKALLSLVEG